MNEELLLKVADQIEMFPDLHNQYTWISMYDYDHIERGQIIYADTEQELLEACGTTACIAGWAIVLSGAKLVNHAGELTPIDENGYEAYWSNYAQDLLDLDDDEASTLFDGGWLPREGLTVPDALRLIAKGEESIDDVSMYNVQE